MSKLLKNIISIPVAYIMFALLFIIADIIFGIIYHYISYQVLAIIPTAIIWIVLQCLASKYLLRKLISNGIYYLEEFYKLKYCSTVVYMVPRA